jgi:hypothetical protein
VKRRELIKRRTIQIVAVVLVFGLVMLATVLIMRKVGDTRGRGNAGGRWEKNNACRYIGDKVMEEYVATSSLFATRCRKFDLTTATPLVLSKIFQILERRTTMLIWKLPNACPVVSSQT